MKLSGWGRYPTHNVRESAPRSIEQLQEFVAAGSAVARGNGRSYGDSAVSAFNTISTRHFNKMISFDTQTGTLVAEAGVLLGDVISSFLPLGFFPYVTPGTKYVTLGGMLAADVHGKNHHLEGSMYNYVDWFEIIDASSKMIRCSRKENSELFSWTIGGMGLTGIIVRVAIRLRPIESAWIAQTTVPVKNLNEAIDAFENNLSSTYSVAWIDCLSSGGSLGRSIVMLGEHAHESVLDDVQKKTLFKHVDRAKWTLPVALPRCLLNRVTVKVFNAMYFRYGQKTKGTRLVSWDSFFYPLDALLGWNKIYGRRGFLQFQCVIPLEISSEGLHELVTEISSTGGGSFLAVLKRLGESAGGISFPMSGYTLALDFPVNGRNMKLMDRLEQITLQYGGRFYLAKDARMSKSTFRSSDSRVTDFISMRENSGMNQNFESMQSTRLGL